MTLITVNTTKWSTSITTTTTTKLRYYYNRNRYYFYYYNNTRCRTSAQRRSRPTYPNTVLIVLNSCQLPPKIRCPTTECRQWVSMKTFCPRNTVVIAFSFCFWSYIFTNLKISWLPTRLSALHRNIISIRCSLSTWVRPQINTRCDLFFDLLTKVVHQYSYSVIEVRTYILILLFWRITHLSYPCMPKRVWT